MKLNFKDISVAMLVPLGLVLISVFFCLLQPVSFRRQPTEDGISKTIFEVQPGMGLKEIAAALKEGNFVRSKIAFEVYAVLSGRAQSLKPGSYLLGSNFSTPRVSKVLANGPEDVLVTVPPGMTMAEIDEKLSSLGVINSGELKDFDVNSLGDDYGWFKGLFGRLSSGVLTKKAGSERINASESYKLEGFLFPDTYYFSPKSDIKIIVGKFLDNFKEKTSPILGGSDNDRLYQAIIIASILEKETPDYEDKRVVAGIVIKRLALQMPLQVDCSVVYLACSERYADCPTLREADYKISSPYNTYAGIGLPPGPISNPGLDSIKAALNPDKSTPYLYYLSDPKTKKTIFSKTLDEHNQNRDKYLLSN